MGSVRHQRGKTQPLSHAAHAQIDDNCIEALYINAKFLHDCSAYPTVAKYLKYYRLLRDDDASASFRALWGKLCAEILSENWEVAHEDLIALQDMIDKNVSTVALR